MTLDDILALPKQRIFSATYDPADHYWFVGGDRSRVFASGRGTYVPVDDKEFQGWLARGDKFVTEVADVATLMSVMWRENTASPGLAERSKGALGSPPTRRRFKAREFIEQLTPTDYDAIQKASLTDPAVGLLWARLLVQGEAPVDTKRDSVKQALDKLADVLGKKRSQEITAALGLHEEKNETRR